MALGLLVGRFGTFVREVHQSSGAAAGGAPSSSAAFPSELNALRDAIAHHLIPLVLLARCDNDYAEREREAIVEHCASLARRRGLELADAQRRALTDYVSDYRPSLLQLDPALSIVAEAPHEEVALLIAAARVVVEADGRVEPEEARFLSELSEELAQALQ